VEEVIHPDFILNVVPSKENTLPLSSSKQWALNPRSMSSVNCKHIAGWSRKVCS
jgi:hypothetical protein